MVEGIYTAYLSGFAGQGLALFVFYNNKIAGADVAGLVFTGSYKIEDERLIGEIVYRMPSGSNSITGATFAEESKPIKVPIDLPTEIPPEETFRINTPIGPLNARFVKTLDLG